MGDNSPSKTIYDDGEKLIIGKDNINEEEVGGKEEKQNGKRDNSFLSVEETIAKTKMKADQEKNQVSGLRYDRMGNDRSSDLNNNMIIQI